LAKGFAIEEAVEAAKRYVTEALQASVELRVGHGAAPLNHLYTLHPRLDG
jgi:hydroxymethylpyrimidine/phosphomethylpyrimidine kinase